MTQPLRHIDDLPPHERLEKLMQIKEYLLKVIYSEILPKMPLEKQIETLRKLEMVGKCGPQSTPVDEDTNMLAEVLSEAESILS